MADKMEGLLLRLEREVIVARKELNNLRKEMNATKKIFCKKFDDIQETVEKGFTGDSYGSAKKRKETKENRLPIHRASDVGMITDELCVSKTIGYLHSCFKEKNGIPRQSSVCLSAKATLKIEYPGITNADHALEGLEEFSHIWILFVFHKNTNRTVKAKVKPPRLNGAKIGVFSSRSPHRPNPIGLSLAKLDGIRGNVLYLSGIDILDGTPVLDIKPYIPFYDQPFPRAMDTICHSDFMETEETDDAITNELQQTSFRSNSSEKIVPETALVNTESNPSDISHSSHYQKENLRLESNSGVEMEVDKQAEPIEAKYIPSFSTHVVSSGNVMETANDDPGDSKNMTHYENEAVGTEKGDGLGESANDEGAAKDVKSYNTQNDQHVQQMEDVTCGMRVVKVESLSDGYFLNQPTCAAEALQPHDVATLSNKQMQATMVQDQLTECSNDNPQQLKDKTQVFLPDSSARTSPTNQDNSPEKVYSQATIPRHNLFCQSDVNNSDRNNSHSETGCSNHQPNALSTLPSKATLIWKGNLPRNDLDLSNSYFSNRALAHQVLYPSCLYNTSGQRTREFPLDGEHDKERRSPYQNQRLHSREPSSPQRNSTHLHECRSNVVASHDQENCGKFSPKPTARHSPTEVRQTSSSPNYCASTGSSVRDPQIPRRQITVPAWIQHPPISQLNVTFSELAESSLMLFHGKNDIQSFNQSFCKKCTENEKTKKTHPTSSRQQCAYRLELISSQSSAKRAIIDILKSDPRSIYRRNQCSDEPYCFSIDVMNITCKFEYNTVLVVKIDPVSTSREAREKEPSEDGDRLPSSAVQFDPCGNRILLGPHHVDAEVVLKNLKDVYDKNQKKTLTGSEQRITNARIDMVATATAEIRRIKVYVQRCPESIRKTGDNIGAIELKISCEKHDLYRTHFNIDLDSVYKTEKGDMVYWLDKVEVEERNKWELIIILEFVDGSFRHFQSKSFRIRTKPRACKFVLAPTTV